MRVTWTCCNHVSLKLCLNLEFVSDAEPSTSVCSTIWRNRKSLIQDDDQCTGSIVILRFYTRQRESFDANVDMKTFKKDELLKRLKWSTRITSKAHALMVGKPCAIQWGFGSESHRWPQRPSATTLQSSVAVTDYILAAAHSTYIYSEEMEY